MTSKEERVEGLEYVLEMYKRVEITLESWDIKDIKQRIKDLEKKISDVKGGISE